MKYKFYTNSEKAWLAMLEDIKHAQKSIYLESFILTDDEKTHSFFENLKNKCREGVKVKIVVDRVGAFLHGTIDKEEFEKVGAEVLFFNRWFYRSHRKILIIDEAIAFLGGVNISGQYAEWLDLHLRLTGLLVRSLLRSFSRLYQIAGGQDPLVLTLRKFKKISKTRLALYKARSWFIERWPIRGKSVLKVYYRKKCAAARKSILIVTPYFVPHQWLIKSLRAAAGRGVKIEVIVPEETDVWLANIAHRVFMENLKNIIKFFFIPEMNHAKVLLVDDREGLIGSNNIDALSFDFNLEASIVFQRKDMIGNLKHILERWKKIAVPVEKTTNYNNWYHKLIGFFIKIFQPIL